jgi:hypothetical protein
MILKLNNIFNKLSYFVCMQSSQLKLIRFNDIKNNKRSRGIKL